MSEAVSIQSLAKVSREAVLENNPSRLLMTTTHTIEIEGQEKPACIAESLAMFFF